MSNQGAIDGALGGSLAKPKAGAQAPAVGLHPNPHLQKTQFDNYYERKLHDERQGHLQFGQKAVMGQLQTNIKSQMKTDGQRPQAFGS